MNEKLDPPKPTPNESLEAIIADLYRQRQRLNNLVEAAKVISQDHKIDHDCFCVLCEALKCLMLYHPR